MIVQLPLKHLGVGLSPTAAATFVSADICIGNTRWSADKEQNGLVHRNKPIIGVW